MRVRNTLFDCEIPGVGPVRLGDVIDVPADVGRDLLAAGWEPAEPTASEASGAPPEAGRGKRKPTQEA